MTVVADSSSPPDLEEEEIEKHVDEAIALSEATRKKVCIDSIQVYDHIQYMTS